MDNLTGKVGIVTGAGRGLGRGTVLRLAQEGMNILAADIIDEVETVADEAKAAGVAGSVIGRKVDITQDDQVADMVQAAVDHWGQLDLIFNNAGVVQPMLDITDTDDALFDRIFNVNVRGVVNGCRHAARIMKEQGGGSIVNTASYYGKTGYAKFGIYCASKGAVILLTQSLAKEMGPHGVRVNAICPGNMGTDMHWGALKNEAKLRGISFDEMVAEVRGTIPLNRHGTPDDIAGAVVWLASADSSYVTGCAINVAGGVEMH